MKKFKYYVVLYCLAAICAVLAGVFSSSFKDVKGQALTTQATQIDIQKIEDNCLIFWTADWCSACKSMKPSVLKLIEEGYTVYIVNSDENKQLARQQGIIALPTSIIYENGKEVKRFIGVVVIEQVKKFLKFNKKLDYQIW